MINEGTTLGDDSLNPFHDTLDLGGDLPSFPLATKIQFVAKQQNRQLLPLVDGYLSIMVPLCQVRYLYIV